MCCCLRSGRVDWALSLVHTGPQLSADDTWATPAVPGQIKEWGYLLWTVDGEDWRCQIIGCLKSNLIFPASDIWHQPTKRVPADMKLQTCKHKDFLQCHNVDLSSWMNIQKWLSEMNEISEFVDQALINTSSGPTPCWSPTLWEIAGSLSRGTILGKNKQRAFQHWKLSIILCFAEKKLWRYARAPEHKVLKSKKVKVSLTNW